MLNISNLNFSYAKNSVIKNFNLSLSKQGVYFLTGQSGKGKTTLLHLIASLLKPQSGTITFFKPDPKIGMVFQEDRLINTISVLKNVELSINPNFPISALNLLKELNIKNDTVHSLPSSLSGGMKRRVAIARAIAFSGDILLMDEPFKGLDLATRTQVYNCFKKYNKAKITIIVSHDKVDIENIEHIKILTM